LFVSLVGRRLRQRRPSTQWLRFDVNEIGLEGRRVLRQGSELALTAREFDLLVYLLKYPRRVHTREQLLVAVWGDDYEGTARTVDNFIRSLCVKLERDPTEPRYILTVRGAGYRFDP